MLTKLSIDFDIPKGANPSASWGSLFHGALMKELPPEIATDLHTEAVRPYAQYVEIISDVKLRWHIGIWNNDISPFILKTVLSLAQVELTGREITLPVSASKRESVPINAYVAHYLAEQKLNRQFEIRFMTPCTHKSGGQYLPFPSILMIYQSIAKRFLAAGDHTHLYDPRIMVDLAAFTRVFRYNLRSTPYFLEGVKILGYTGYVCVDISGSEELLRQSGLLLSLANYLGIGIKTAMGMGGCTVEPIPLPSSGKSKMLQCQLSYRRDINA